MSAKFLSLPKRARRYLRNRKDSHIIRSSGLFDEAWYLANNPDVDQSKIDPILHYLHYGGFEGRDPGPNFSGTWYLNTYHDVRNAGVNPLIHYLSHGRSEGRAPLPNSGSGRYRESKHPQAQTGLQGLRGFLLSRYDIGLSYDPPSSFADLLLRYFYARQFQKEYFNLPRQIIWQYQLVPILFHLRQAIRKLKLGKIPVRIVFLAQASVIWKPMDSLYRACLTDPHFKTYIVNIGFHIHGVFTDCSTYFTKENIEFLDGINNEFRIDLLNPDIIVLSSPYDSYRPFQYHTANLLRYARLVYIPYGIGFSDEAGKLSKQTFGYDTQKNAWRIFTRSKKTLGKYKKYGGIPSHRVVGLGAPVIDQYYSSSSSGVLPDEIQSASAGKFKIIYSPHHTIDGWSTFLQYFGHIRRLIDENKDCFLVFRPHPLLMGTLKEMDLMSEETFRSLFSGDRCYLYEGDDYYGLFHWSDMLISDASSFLVEYAPTKKPIVYLNRKDGWGLDDTIREDIFEGYYVASSADEITAFFQQIRNGVDPLRSERVRVQENMSKGMFTGGAGKRIAAYLRNTLA